MAPGSPRNHLSSSSLIRLLQDHGDHASTLGGTPQQTFAERLSQWLGWTDAIALSAVMNGGDSGAVPSTVTRGRFMPARGALAEFDRARSDLAQAIESDRVIAPLPPAPVKAKAPTRRPSAFALTGAPPADAPAAPADDHNDFAPCRRQLAAHQRAMTERIATLRADLRLALTNQSAALGQLAAVDAVMEDALAAREKHLLSLVPALLERRFDQLRSTQPTPEPTPADGDHAPPATPTPPATTTPPSPPAWRMACGREMQDVLLAELDLRLQPVHGLIEALDHAITTGQAQ